MSGNYESIINTAIDADFFPLTKLFTNEPFQPRLTSLNPDPQYEGCGDVVVCHRITEK